MEQDCHGYDSHQTTNGCAVEGARDNPECKAPSMIGETSWRERLRVQEAPPNTTKSLGGADFLSFLETLARRLFFRFHLDSPSRGIAPFRSPSSLVQVMRHSEQKLVAGYFLPLLGAAAVRPEKRGFAIRAGVDFFNGAQIIQRRPRGKMRESRPPGTCDFCSRQVRDRVFRIAVPHV